MLLKKTNIEEKLSRSRSKENRGENVLKEVYDILAKDTETEAGIAKRLTGNPDAPLNRFHFDLLDTQRIFHLDQIKEICIDYRLRFLNSRYFKGAFPPTAISRIKALEKQHSLEIKGFMIMAPSKLFKLEDKDDPLLFAPIGNGYFYLVHRWGNDLHPLRKWLMWPFKNLRNLVLLVLAISYLATLLIPEGLFSKTHSHSEFWIVFFFMFKSIAAVVLFYGVALGKNFNPAIWNSKYSNA